jgi:hypothetical protein
MRLPVYLSAPLILGAVIATDAAGEKPPAEFDRVCASHAEGAEPNDVALPDPRTDIVASRLTISGARVTARHLSRRKRPSNPRAWILKTPAANVHPTPVPGSSRRR